MIHYSSGPALAFQMTEIESISIERNRQPEHTRPETGRPFRGQGQNHSKSQTQGRNSDSDSNPDSGPDPAERRADGPSDSDTRASGQDDSDSSPTEQSTHAQFTTGVEDSTRVSFGSPDSITIALTLRAGRRLESPGAVVESARVWADWIGVVGEANTQRLKEFCDEFSLNPDFINGTGTGPAERLASIGEGSVFHAKRTVVVGTPDERSVAVAAGWEFVPITEAASKATWEL